LNRRTLLLALSTLATPALPLRALAASAPPAPPPPPPDDTYGFSSTLRAEGVGGPTARDLSSWIKTLKVLGEAPLLTADTPAGGPAFRLTVLSARKPAVCLHVTWSEDRRLATAMISTGDGLGVPGQRTKTVRRDFAMPSATALLELADARETFWDAAPLPPDWDAIQASTKVYAELAPVLPKNEPPKGNKESWKKATDAFSSQVKAMEDAAEKKDAAALKTAFGKMSMSCMGCHRMHKG